MWEQVEEGLWSNGVVWLKPNSTYSAMWGNTIYALKPDREEKLWELQVTKFMLPEHLERLRAAKKKEELVDVLELLPDATSGPTSLEVAHCVVFLFNFSVKSPQKMFIFIMVIKFMMPEHLERLSSVKKKEGIIDVLELLPDATSGPTPLEVARCVVFIFNIRSHPELFSFYEAK